MKLLVTLLLWVSDSVSISSHDEWYGNANAHFASPAAARLLFSGDPFEFEQDALGTCRARSWIMLSRRRDCGRHPNYPQSGGEIHACRGCRDRKHNYSGDATGAGGGEWCEFVILSDHRSCPKHASSSLYNSHLYRSAHGVVVVVCWNEGRRDGPQLLKLLCRTQP